jgi:putative phage-type endonuclease
VSFLSYANEDEWHELRKGGIGGSDAGAIMGLNKYTSPLKLYRIKTGVYTEDNEDNVYIKKGKDLESLIFEKYVRNDPELKYHTVVHPQHVFVNQQYPWLRANCDGLAVGPVGHIVIEIKWVSEWAEVNWDGDDYCGIPASYYAQVQHYMTVTGASTAILYAMFDKDWRVKKYTIPYNRSFALTLISKTKEFYDMLLANKEPAITATLDKEFMPEALERMPIKTEESADLDQAIAEYLAFKEDIKQLELSMNKAYDTAVAMYLEGKRPTKLFGMSISNCKKTGFDAKRFAADHPEVYEQYKTVSEYTTTRMKRK